MSLQSFTTSNIINGISQQADTLRFPTQVEDQVNDLASPVSGLSKRNPTEYLNKLTSEGTTLGTDTFFHNVVRDNNEQYVIAVTSDSTPQIKVYDYEGNEKTVRKIGGGSLSTSDVSYLSCSNPSQKLKALTVGDNTIIVNSESTVTMDATTSTDRTPEAMVFIKVATAASVYDVDLYTGPNRTGTHYRGFYATPSSGSFTFWDIANGIYSSFVSAGALTVFDVIRGDNGHLYIRKKDGSEFSGNAGAERPDAINFLKDEVEALSDLPKESVQGFKIKVTGTAEDTALPDGYYVEFNAIDTTVYATPSVLEGSWRECIADGITYAIDEATAPHRLISVGSGIYEFGPCEWLDREVGDTDSNANPSFIDNTIEDIFFYKNRLGFISGENVCLSETSAFFNFFRTTVIDLLDSDRIDNSTTTKDIIKLFSAISVERDLLVLGERAQFLLDSGDQALAPSTVSMTSVSNLTLDPTTRPARLGSSLFLGFTRGQYAGVYEYIRQDQFSPYESIDRTEHVPRLLAGNIIKILAYAQSNQLYVLADGYTTGLYVYSFFDRNSERLQSAWFKYDFGARVLDCFEHEDYLYLVINRDTATTLERINLGEGINDTGSSIYAKIDMRITEADCTSITYDSIEELTTVTLPYYIGDNDEFELITRVDGSDVGMDRLQVYSKVANNQFKIRGDHTSTKFYVGKKYESYTVLTKPFPRLGGGGQQGDRVATRAKFFVRNGLVTVNDTTAFKVQVENVGKKTYTYDYLNSYLGTTSSTANNSLVPGDESFRFPIYENYKYTKITLKNDTPYPSNYVTIDWEGVITARS